VFDRPAGEPLAARRVAAGVDAVGVAGQPATGPRTAVRVCGRAGVGATPDRFSASATAPGHGLLRRCLGLGASNLRRGITLDWHGRPPGTVAALSDGGGL